jgi:hypothetical protein
MRKHVGAAFSLLVLALLALVGCQPTPAKPVAPTPAPAKTVAAAPAEDVCVERLHDYCQKLLLYYAVHKELPADIGGLACPVSGKPYIYFRDGLPLLDRDELLVIYDAVPCHGNTRFGILIERPRPGQALVCRVARLPESAIPASRQRVESGE